MEKGPSQAAPPHFPHLPFSFDNPFRTPAASAPSEAVSVITEFRAGPAKQRKFKSSRLIGEYDKPWTKKKDPRMVWDKIFFWGFAFVGLCIGGFIIYRGLETVHNPDYCLIFEDDFSNGISSDNWNHEVELGGFGVGEFDWTTTDSKNAYTDAEGLHIVPTLTTETTDITAGDLMDNYALNLTAPPNGDGSCTNAEKVPGSACSVRSNSTSGVIINPVRSARLNTKGKHSITYGKVEVVAKLPKGDWMWPAIWMMPQDNVYGAWPASGEIDLMESKGNNPATYSGGRQTVSGTLHWGPYSNLDRFIKTTGVRYLRRTDFSDAYHTFGVEWTQDYIFTYVDSRLAQSLYVPFGKKWGNLYDRGKFADDIYNGSVPADPWANTGNYNAPFDQAFYLILNVAVGSTNGYFEDGYARKPWVDASPTAMRDFWDAQQAWYPTWGKGADRGMTVKSVKMWSLGTCAAGKNKR